jgi:integrase
MSVTKANREIPTVAKAVERFISSRQNQYTGSYVSVLQGARTGHVVGIRSAGVALARSELGDLRFDRVKGHEFVLWLHQRHEGLAADTFKRGRSALHQLLLYAVAEGWADETIVGSLPKAYRSPARRDWLRPEQVVALGAFVTHDRFTSQQRFMWSVLLNTGVRSDELIRLQPQALNPLDGTLTVIGKGSGDGKLRYIPISPEFQDDWLEYVRQNQLRPSAWIFPLMGVRFIDGTNSEHVILDARRHCSAKAAINVTGKVREFAKQAVANGQLDEVLVPHFAVTPQVLRRTYACTNLIAHALGDPGDGMDIRSLQRAMGHASLETTAIYLSDVEEYIHRHRRTRSVTDTVKQLAAKLSSSASEPGSLAA